MKKIKKQKRLPNTPVGVIRKFNTRGAKPILELAESTLLDTAVRAAAKGSR